MRIGSRALLGPRFKKKRFFFIFCGFFSYFLIGSAVHPTAAIPFRCDAVAVATSLCSFFFFLNESKKQTNNKKK